LDAITKRGCRIGLPTDEEDIHFRCPDWRLHDTEREASRREDLFDE
jgi:hypothetical protein